jgi:ER lumen protein retaining receptor
MIDIFRYIADSLHFISMILLLNQIFKKKNCMGLSYRTQEIYLVVFLTRYSSIFFADQNWVHLGLKILAILLTLTTIYLIKFKKPYSITYDKIYDSFPHYTTIYPFCMILTTIFHVTFRNHPYFQYVWTFSIILEAFAIIPQLYIMRKVDDIDIFTSSFMICLGLYRFFDILHWLQNIYIDKKIILNTHIIHMEIFFAMVQTLLYSEFIYRYYKSFKRSQHIQIPI